MFGKVVSDSQRDCVGRFPYVMAAYRASRNEVTGFSTNLLVFGREVAVADRLGFRQSGRFSSNQSFGFRRAAGASVARGVLPRSETPGRAGAAT